METSVDGAAVVQTGVVEEEIVSVPVEVGPRIVEPEVTEWVSEEAVEVAVDSEEDQDLVEEAVVQVVVVVAEVILEDLEMLVQDRLRGLVAVEEEEADKQMDMIISCK